MAILRTGTAFIGGIGASVSGGAGAGIAEAFLRKGWRVFAGFSPGAEDDMATLAERFGGSIGGSAGGSADGSGGDSTGGLAGDATRASTGGSMRASTDSSGDNSADGSMCASAGGSGILASPGSPECPAGQRFVALRADPSSDGELARAAAAVAGMTDSIELLVFCGDRFGAGPVRGIVGGQDYGELRASYDANALGLLRTVRSFLPLLDGGSMRRLCFLTDSGALVNGEATGQDFGRAMSKAAANMAAAILFNRLRPKGYTFRVFCRDDSASGAVLEAAAAYEHFVRDRSFEADNPRHSDENRFTARDSSGRERPW